ncbi:ligand-gated ion channel [Planctomicrobium piriforme]|nr:hypothetical protein [Planctomicrobium piriforme]
MRRWLWCAASWLVLLSSSAPAFELTPQQLREGMRWPGEGGRRIPVSIGIEVIDFARVNLREESFAMAGYLDVTWVDPTLALQPNEGSEIRRFRPQQIWTPALEFVNAVEQVNGEREVDVYVTRDGHASQRIRFSHNFQSALDLQRFPFDRQRLFIEVAPFDPFAKDIDLSIDEGRVGMLEGASVPDWNLDSVNARLDQPNQAEAAGRFVFEVSISRRYTFYVWRVFLPITLLVVASWTAFWFDPVNLQPLITVSLSILLSLVTFTYAVDFSLPKVAYLTFTDRYVITAFSFVVSTLFVVAAMHICVRTNHLPRALLLQKIARIAFPVSFFTVIGLIAIITL